MAFRVSHFGRKTNKATLPPPENPAAIGKQNKTKQKNKNKFQLPKHNPRLCFSTRRERLIKCRLVVFRGY